MKFRPLPLAGAYTIELQPVRDHRGFNARAWCAQDFEAQGLCARFVQTNLIVNGPRGTLRGLHYQVAPMAEAKLFRVTQGAIYDVIVDLREDSTTYRKWCGVELHANAYTMLYVPEGFAQGFQTLAENTELNYQVSSSYSPDHGRGIRYDDPILGIAWPLEVTAISERDLSWPGLEGAPA